MLKRLLLAAAVVSVLPTNSVTANQNVVVVLDDSGSMGERMRGRRETKMEAAKNALISVLEQLPEDTVVGVLLLNGRVNGEPWVIPLGPIDRQSMRSAIQAIRHRSGTPLGKFMKIGADALLELRDARHYGTYRLLVVTDGEASDKRLVEQYLPDIMSRGISVDVIGVDMKGNHSLATKVHSYRRADDPEKLTQALSEIFAETSDKDQDTTGVSDFEFLAGFPDEVAVAALGALSETFNQPIGEPHRPVLDVTPSRNAATTRAPEQTQPTPPREKRRGRGSLFWTVLVIFVVLWVGKGLIAGRKRRR